MTTRVRTSIGALGVLATLTLIAGCAQPVTPSIPEPSASASASPTPEASPTPTEEPWVTVSDPRIADSFQIPPTWTVTEHVTAPGIDDVVSFSLADADGVAQLWFTSRVQGIGGNCSGDWLKFVPVVLDEEPLDLAINPRASGEVGFVPVGEPRFTYQAVQLPDRVRTTISVTNLVPTEPECLHFMFLATDDRSAVFGDSFQLDSFDVEPALGYEPREFPTMAEAEAFMDTELYATIKRILTSYQIAG